MRRGMIVALLLAGVVTSHSAVTAAPFGTAPDLVDSSMVPAAPATDAAPPTIDTDLGPSATDAAGVVAWGPRPSGERGFGLQSSPWDELPDGFVVDQVPERVVVLIHGLDDPGRIFRDLVGALRAGGHWPLEFIYANDGPIAGAADLLARELRELRSIGVESVDLVAHSMGGLVSRDLLTRTEYYGGDARGLGRLPAVERLIMCGTPHLGSHAARLRWVSEVREHVVRATTGRGHLLGGRHDGDGTAGRDLRPGSDFLEHLNARPAPDHVQLTCIAGYATALSPTAAARAAAAVERRTLVGGPRWWQRAVGAVGRSIATSLTGGVSGVGDGVVTLRSALLAGVEDAVIVRAGHGSMLRSGLLGRREPPAIALVLERLGEPPVASTAVIRPSVRLARVGG